MIDGISLHAQTLCSGVFSPPLAQRGCAKREETPFSPKLMLSHIPCEGWKTRSTAVTGNLHAIAVARSAISKKIARRLQEGSLGSQVPRTTPIVGIKGKDKAIRVVVAAVLPAEEDRSQARSSSSSSRSSSRSRGPALRLPQQVALLLRSGRCKWGKPLQYRALNRRQ